jgi:hypothetical protein
MDPRTKAYIKAVGAGLTAFIGTTSLVLSSQPEAHQGIQYLSQLQWGIIALHVLGAYGLFWNNPDKAGTNALQNLLDTLTASNSPSQSEAVSAAPVAAEPVMGATVVAADQGKHSA